MTCGHDKSFKERCIECELVLVREGLAWSERKAAEYREAAVRLEAELAAYPLTRPDRGGE